MTRRRVLVVDDEPQILRALSIILRDAGYDVTVAADLAAARAMLAERPPDAIVLDLRLPDGTGRELCVETRRWSEVPIVIVSAIGDEGEKIAALDAGADDYLTKPFNAPELLARLRAVLRRSPDGAAGRFVEAGELRIDLADRRVERHGELVHLTPIEWGLLSALARRRGRLVTHRVLLREVWGAAYTTETHYLRVHIAHIRAKLEDDPARPRYVLTDAGVGYRFGMGEG